MPTKPKRATIPVIWYKSILKKQADEEKKRIAVLKKIREALYSLEKKYHWDEAYIFGSVASEGKFRRNSDIDIAVLGLKSIDYYAFIGEISDLLNKRVDVVLLEENHFADSIKKKGIKCNRKTGL